MWYKKSHYMANILVPTDFTPASLRWAEEAIRKTGEISANIFLFHAFELPSNEFDLLGSTFKDPYAEMVNEPFRQACKQLKDEYPRQVNKIFTRCMNGNTRAVFRNFAEANDIDLIYYPVDFIFSPVHHRSVDPLPLFIKSGVPLLKAHNASKEPSFSNQRFAVLNWLLPAGRTTS